MSFREPWRIGILYAPDSEPVTGKGWPVETPGKNGPYAGAVPVRVIPPGVSGEDLLASQYGLRGHKLVAKQTWKYRQRAALKSKQRGA